LKWQESMPRQALPDDSLEPVVRQQQLELASLIERYTGRDGVHPTAVPSLFLYRSSTPSDPLCNVQEPAFGVIAQGSKRVTLGDEVYVYGKAHYIVVSVDLPVVGQVIEATPDAPYLGIRIDLDIRLLGTLLVEVGLPEPANQQTRRGLFVSRIASPLLEAVLRLMRLLENPHDIPVLAPLILREIHYRLLVGDQSARLRQIALANSQSQRIAKAIAWLKRNYARPLRIETVARELHMSPSSLHHHFKAVTAMSPLQYQKQLRLQEARRLMLSETVDAATAGHRVGYESPSQFSREYSRLFGAPPVRDMARLRESLQVSAEQVTT
jgi:AraC-like DNA-binding protein